MVVLGFITGLCAREYGEVFKSALSVAEKKIVRLQKVWEVQIEDLSTDVPFGSPPPIFCNGKVYVLNTRGFLKAVALADGSWKEFSNVGLVYSNSFFGGGLCSDGKNLYLATNRIIAISFNGKVLWSKVTNTPVRTPPVVVDDSLYVQDVNSEVRALDKASGRIRWICSSLRSPVYNHGRVGFNSYKDNIIVTTSYGNLMCIDKLSGSKIWSVTLRTEESSALQNNSMTDIVGAAVIIDDRILASSQDGVLAMVSAVNGDFLWKKNHSLYASPVTDGKKIFIVDTEHKLVCYDLEGNALWQKSLPDFVLYAVEYSHSLKKYSATAKKDKNILWDPPVEYKDIESQVEYLALFLVSGKLVIFCNNGFVFIVSPDAGKLLGVKNLGKYVLLPPLSVPEGWVVSHIDGSLAFYR